MSTTKPIHVFDMNGTLIAKDLAPVFEQHFRKKILEPLFSTLLSLSQEDWKKQFPEAADANILPQTTHDRLLPLLANPPKFTPARHAYYHVIEGEIRKGEVNVGLEPDVVTDTSALTHLKDADVSTMLLSRGTASLIEAICDALPILKERISFLDSTISYGNTKTVDTYLALVEALQQKGYTPTAFYDDESIFVKELVLTSKQIAERGGTPFTVFWVNRAQESEDVLWNLFTEQEKAYAKQWVRIYANLQFNPLVV